MNDKITCPNCSHEFDVEEALSGQLEARIREQYQEKIEKQAEVFRKQQTQLEQEREAFEKAKERENELFKERLERQRKIDREKIQREFEENANAELLALKEDNEKRKEELRAMRDKELLLLKREQQLKDQQENMELEMRKKLIEESKKYEEQGRAKEREATEMREKEYQKVIEDLKKSLEESKRKAEQGSMQLQGEVQELAIEEYLQFNFPFDQIEEIKKGSTGGDCVQHINTRELKNCGSIYYESKRTKGFSEAWVDKLKSDMQSKGTAIGVIVTQTMPNDMERMGMRNGVWVCDYQEFKGLSHVLRESLIMLRKNVIVQEGKGDKMSMLYDFLTSTEFKMQIESIVDGFTAMRNQLDTEKRAFYRQWKEREKQIDKVVQSTVEMYGSIKGIAGKAVPTIDVLELDTGDDEQQQLDF